MPKQKPDSVKGGIQELISVVQTSNGLMTDAATRQQFTNYALEMINNNIGSHLINIEAIAKEVQGLTFRVNENIVAIGLSQQKQLDTLLDYAMVSTRALENINNSLVDSSNDTRAMLDLAAEDSYINRGNRNELVDMVDGLKAMQTAMEADRLKQKEIAAEQAQFSEKMLLALQSQVGDVKDPKAKEKKKDKKDKEPGAMSKFGGMMKDIGAGMLDAGKGLLALGAAVWIIADAFGKFAAVSWSDMTKGLLVLGGLTLAAKVMAKGNGKESWKPIAAIAGSMLALSFAFEKFAALDWGDLAKGLVVLGGLAIAVKLMSGATGAAAMLAIGASVLVMSFAFEKFAALEWGDLAKGLVVLGALAAVTIALGSMAPVVLVGAAAMLAIGAAMWIAAKAFEVVAESMTKFNAGLKELASIDGEGLKNTAGALGILGAAMAAFGAGQAAAGLGTLVSNLLTIGQDSPVEQIMKLAGAGDGLLKTASGLDAVATAMQKFAGLSPDSMKAINDFPWLKATAFVAAGGSMTVQGATVTSAKQQLANTQDQNTQLSGDKAVGEAAATAAGVSALGSSNKQVIVNNGGPTAILSSKTTSWDPEDMWARGGMSMMGG